MTREKASHDPGLSPMKGHKFCPGAQTRSRDKLVSPPLGITKTSPLGPVLVTINGYTIRNSLKQIMFSLLLYEILCTTTDSAQVPQLLGTAVAQWLRCCATSRKVTGSIPAGAIGIFY